VSLAAQPPGVNAKPDFIFRRICFRLNLPYNDTAPIRLSEFWSLRPVGTTNI